LRGTGNGGDNSANGFGRQCSRHRDKSAACKGIERRTSTVVLASAMAGGGHITSFAVAGDPGSGKGAGNSPA
jgi:hypothetical protein